MENLLATGRLWFAVCIVALGVETFVCAHIQQPVLPLLPWLPRHPALSYLTGIVLILLGLAIASNFLTRWAAVLLAVVFVLCEILLQIPRATAAPFDLSLRTAVFEVLSLGAAAMILARMSSHPDAPGKKLNLLDKVLSSGRYLFAVSSVTFGISHFLVGPFIATLIPEWIPFRLFFAYFTGAAFVAAGLSIAAGCLDVLAATLLGAMFLVWFLFLHLPRVFTIEKLHNPAEWSSAFIALGMFGASWIIARDAMSRKA